MPIGSIFSPLSQNVPDDVISRLFQSSSGSTSEDAEPDRQPILFTSSLRQRGVRFGAGGRDLVTAQSGDFNEESQIFAQLEFSGRPSSSVEDVTKQLTRYTQSIISLDLNPRVFAPTRSKRYTKLDHQNGSDFLFWTDDKGQNQDIMTLRFEGNTGNIFIAHQDQNARDLAMNRLQIFHDLYQLTREPIRLSDGTQNVTSISYVSPLFPVPVLFEGFFNQELVFSENAMKPRSRDWSFEFTVQSTSPNMNDLMSHIFDLSLTTTQPIPAPEAQVLESPGPPGVIQARNRTPQA